MSPRVAETTHPTPVQRLRQSAWRELREARDRFGQVSSNRRMRPGFIIAGAQRCGTTTLFRQLRQHPNVLTSRLVKGVHWFDLAYDRPAEWYFGHFPLRTQGRSQVITGEASPYYLFHPMAAQRIADVLPAVKLIVLLRHPVARAWSHYQHEIARGFETRPFERALREEPAMMAEEEARLRRDPLAQSFAHQHFSYVARGRYAEQLERLWAHVPRHQVLVLESQRLTPDHAAVFTEVCAFLGLRPWAPAQPEHMNARSYARLEPALRERLGARFAEDRARLQQLTGIGRDWD